MNENARKWVSALRSGEYKQAKGKLRTPEGFCCLGVACDLYAKEHPEARWTDNLEFHYSIYVSVLKLPAEVVEWLAPTSTGLVFQNHLTRLNDGGASFAQIADVIEGQLESIFS